MKIAYITAGAADMYCGSCIHDNTLAAALQKEGADVSLIPTYTPIRTDELDVSLNRLFYSGINVYLQQKFGFFRKGPKAFDFLFARPALVRLVTRFASSTNAKDLGALTVSVLKGREGNQSRELAKLVEWLKHSLQPDVVGLTNSMFLGLARPIREALGVPLLCTLQGEELFLDNLVQPYRSEARQLLQEKAQDADGFLATGEHYADFMSDYLQVPRQKIHVVHLGLNLKGHGLEEGTPAENPLVIGYLARICPEKGLHLLVEAFKKLAHSLGPERVHLKAAGYLSRENRPYLEKVESDLKSSGFQNQFEYLGEVDRQQKIDFLNSIDVFSVPATFAEPKGLYVLEALANEVPVVLPGHGIFPELIRETGGGILIEPGSADSLASGLEQLLQDAARRQQLGRQGKKSVFRAFSDQVMARNTLAIYQRLIESARAEVPAN